MAVSILKGLLQEYVQALFDEGIVDERFLQIQYLINLEQFDHVIQLINTYFSDVEKNLSKFIGYIDSTSVDSPKLSVLAHKIREESTCIGAEHVRLASIHLIQACDQEDHKTQKNKIQAFNIDFFTRPRFLKMVFLVIRACNVSQALNWTKHEFTITRNKLEPIVQMGRRIVKLINKQQQ